MSQAKRRYLIIEDTDTPPTDGGQGGTDGGPSAVPMTRPPVRPGIALPGGGVFLEGDSTCTYAGTTYSGGSTVSMPAPGGGTVVKTCNPNTGRWD